MKCLFTFHADMRLEDYPDMKPGSTIEMPWNEAVAGPSSSSHQLSAVYQQLPSAVSSSQQPLAASYPVSHAAHSSRLHMCGLLQLRALAPSTALFVSSTIAYALCQSAVSSVRLNLLNDLVQMIVMRCICCYPLHTGQ
jgi:hypothetical protein